MASAVLSVALLAGCAHASDDAAKHETLEEQTTQHEETQGGDASTQGASVAIDADAAMWDAYDDAKDSAITALLTRMDEEREYAIDLRGADLSYIVCGFGYVLSGDASGEASNVFFLDEIRFTGNIESLESAPVMLRSYDTSNVYIQNAAFSYDNALAAMALISDNRQEEAAQLLDAFVYAINNDRACLTDAEANAAQSPTARPMRVRNAYAAGDISAYPGWESGARLPGWYDATAGEWLEDRYQVGSNVGNTSDERYAEAAQSALDFILSMYDEEQGLFMTGTTDDGKTPNKDVVVLDAQVWSAMALQEEFEPFVNALDVVSSMRTEEGGYPFCRENENGGWWAEGTAYTALMWRERGDVQNYTQAMDTLARAQLADGLFRAASVDDLSCGMDLFDGSPWEYSRDPHIAPTAWFVMAANGFNPYVFPAK